MSKTDANIDNDNNNISKLLWEMIVHRMLLWLENCKNELFALFSFTVNSNLSSVCNLCTTKLVKILVQCEVLHAAYSHFMKILTFNFLPFTLMQWNQYELRTVFGHSLLSHTDLVYSNKTLPPVTCAVTEWWVGEPLHYKANYSKKYIAPEEQSATRNIQWTLSVYAWNYFRWL